ncbi:MAG: ExbD/TolR family protein [Bradymonadaceae bacterium]
MSRRGNRRNRSNDGDDLNLTPFMNMVVILIPLLLLSVVFLKVGVINVSSPTIAPGPSHPPSKDLGLTVGISESGFTISTRDKTIPAIEDCPDDGPTVCLARSEIAVDAKIDRARQALENGRKKEGEALLDEVVAAYDFAGLYSELRTIKDNHPGESTVRLTASPDIPYQLLVRVMDAVRFKLDQKRYASNEAFWQASTETRDGSKDGKLFSEPVLAVGK